ncbi:MAG: M15 family metallopeptidase [Bacilli bacterium]|nr:M15 family metallopeptidase [Bacilli bacterium]
MARKKKRKLSIKKISIVIFVIITISIITVNFDSIRNVYLSKISGYNKESISVFIENDIYKDIKNHEYSKTLETIINTEYYNKNYLDEYLDIVFVENENFLQNTSLLLDKGYSSNDINNIYDKLTENSINVLINNDYFKDITNIISINYFKEDKLERYINYYNEEDDLETILTYVNIGLDNGYYTNVIEIEDQNNLLVLVNKYNKLQNDFVPKDLETISSKYGNGSLRKEARIAFEEMCAAAKDDGITIYGGSGYRSYSHQLRLYNNYVAIDGKIEADTYSARAGHSEHQTGLAMDILNGRWSFIDDNDKEYTWLVNNSYKYGFILRYLEGKEEITGYMYEPWHYRFVGVDVAKEIIQLGITYDEYVAKK